MTLIDIPSLSTGLYLGEDGIWYSLEVETISYPEDGNEICLALEERSFWFRHRNRCIVTLVKSFPPPEGGAIFDIGGGNGFVALGLAQAGFEVALVEPGKQGAQNAKRRGVPTVICATVASAHFKPHSLPAVGLFDVIEHVSDDLSFLCSIREVIQNGGRLYASVPAYPSLWSQEDVLAGHFRRYSRRRMHQLLERAGFEVEFSSYIFGFLPPLIWLFRALPYRLGIAQPVRKIHEVYRDHAVTAGTFSRLIEALLSYEVRLLEKRVPLGFGSSCLVVARRR